jgi:putative transposase
MTPLMAEERPPRLPGYDYSQAGAYFITICTKNKEPLFWSSPVGHSLSPERPSPSPVGPYGHTAPLEINPFGQIAAEQWLKSAEIRKEVTLGEWVVMPDHFHGILFLSAPDVGSSSPSVGAYGHTPPQKERTQQAFRSPSKTVGAMVRGFKGAVTTAINTIRQTPGAPVWQSNYYEHIIRNEAAFHRISAYIRNNPIKAGLVGQSPVEYGESLVGQFLVGPYGHPAPQGIDENELNLKRILEEQP